MRFALPLIMLRHTTPRATNVCYRALPDKLETVGDHIRRRRLTLKLLQQQVAQQVGVNEATVTNWETNSAEPGVKAEVAFLLALPLAGATRGFCAPALAFLVGLGFSTTGTATFVSVMLVPILRRSPFPGVIPVRTFIALVPSRSKVDLTDSEGNVSRARNRALESPGRAWR